MYAAYVFGVRFELDTASGVHTDPREFETTLHYRAADPGEEGWLFFRDTLWRGELNAEAHLREVATDWLGVPVTGVEFRELRLDEEYLEAFEAAIDAELGAFRADSVREVKHKYLGSSVHVTGAEGTWSSRP